MTAKSLKLEGAAYGLIEKYLNFLTGNTKETNKKHRSNGEWFEYQILPGMTFDEIVEQSGMPEETANLIRQYIEQI